jgi:RNA polymerase sigma-70 factor, ECF subfamily
MTAGTAAWVDRAKAGDCHAFGAIVQHYEARIRAYCLRLMGDLSDAEDLTQETFLKAFCALPQTSADLALSAWLYRIAANACTDALRQRQRARALPWEPSHAEHPTGRRDDDPEAALLDAEAQRAFGAMVQCLSPRNRQALLLRCRDDYSLREIGTQLHLSEPAVKSLLFRARTEFRSYAAQLAESA